MRGSAGSACRSTGPRGGTALKKLLTEALNETLRPLCARRRELEPDAVEVERSVLGASTPAANHVAERTLQETRRVMNMDYGL